MKKLVSSDNGVYTYEAPIIEFIEVEIEQGFAMSGLNYGRDGGAGGDISEEDVIWGGDY